MLRDQWRTATAAGDRDHAAEIEATARRVQAELAKPESASLAEAATVHGWWLASAAPIHPGCGTCRRAPGGPDHRS